MSTDIEKLYNKLYVSEGLLVTLQVPLAMRSKYAKLVQNIAAHLNADDATKRWLYTRCFGIGELSDRVPDTNPEGIVR